MRIRCQRCDTTFERPLDSVGQIEFTGGCKNVFRVNYGLKTPCPSCLAILTVISQGEQTAVGRPAQISQKESTMVGLRDVLSIAEEPPETSDPESKTVPRTLDVTEVRDQPPAIRVREPEALPQTQRRPESAFEMIKSMPTMPKPKHFSLRKPSKKAGAFPWMKVLFGVVIGTCASLTILLTILAFQGTNTQAETIESLPPAQAQPPASDQVKSPKRLTQPQGGPEEEPLQEEVQEAPRRLTGNPTVASIPKPKPTKEREDWTLHVQRLDNLTSSYGYRKDPFTKKKKFHGGIDIKARYRSEVQAALKGKVIYTGWKGGYGKVVIIEHAEGLRTLYGHLSKPLASEGDEIEKGSLIGLAGSTGRSTGPHLHFEVIKDGRKINPMPYINAVTADISEHVFSDHS